MGEWDCHMTKCRGRPSCESVSIAGFQFCLQGAAISLTLDRLNAMLFRQLLLCLPELGLSQQG